MTAIIEAAVQLPPGMELSIREILGYAFWIGTVVFAIGLGWAAVRFFVANPDDAPGSQDKRRTYVAIVLIAGILMSSAAGIGTALVDANSRGSSHGPTSQKF